MTETTYIVNIGIVVVSFLISSIFLGIPWYFLGKCSIDLERKILEKESFALEDKTRYSKSKNYTIGRGYIERQSIGRDNILRNEVKVSELKTDEGGFKYVTLSHYCKIEGKTYFIDVTKLGSDREFSIEINTASFILTHKCYNNF